MRMLRGDLLPASVQREALMQFTHRYTGDHTPAWARIPRADGTRYPLQFASDAEWLANTVFAVTSSGLLAWTSG